jgi:hypothetical protein
VAEVRVNQQLSILIETGGTDDDTHTLSQEPNGECASGKRA